MPSSPFGLAYGIGAGIAGAQQQMQNRQQAALAMNMQGLQMQALQRQQAEQQALNEALSAQVPQQTSPNTALLNSLPMAPVSPETQASMASNGLPSATAIPNAPTASQMEAINAPQDTRLVKPTEYVTPYQRQAYELSQRAQMLQKKGFGLSAMKLNEQAMQFGQMHQNMALQQAGRAMASGSYQSAVPYLNSVGFDVKSIGIDPDDPGKVAITHSDGSQSLVPKEVASMIAADPTKMAEAMPMIEYRKSLAETAKERAATAAANQRSLESHRKALEDIAQQKLTAQKTVFGPTGAKTPAKQLLWDAAEEDARKLHPGATDQEIYEFVKDDPRVSTAKTNVQNALNIQIRSLQAEQKQYLNAMGQAPAQDPNNPRSVRYYELQNLINEARANLLQPRQHIPSPKAATPEQPKQNYDGEISPTGAWKFSGPLGKWVPNK